MTNKKRILNLIKEELKTDTEIAWAYSQLVPCDRCLFKKECDKETETRGRCKCTEMIKNKLKEDKSDDQ